jgi:hypothetical protein
VRQDFERSGHRVALAPCAAAPAAALEAAAEAAAAEAAAAEAAPLPPELEFALVLVVRHLAVKTNHGPTDRFRT